MVGGFGLADDPGDEGLECLAVTLANELADLDGEDLGGVHLPVEELDDAAEGRGDEVGDEEESHAARLKVQSGLFPDVFRRDTGTEELFELGVGILTTEGAGGFELGADALDRPIGDGVRGIVEHLADDLAADAGVAAALDLDERGDSVLVEEEMIQGPAVGATELARDASLAVNEEPTTGDPRIDLVSREQFHVVGQERLEQRCGFVRLLGHSYETARIRQEKDPAIHPPTYSPSAPERARA